MLEIDKIAFIAIRDGYILSTRSRGKTTFYIPGGKREAGETDKETLAREVLEELSIKIISGSEQYIGTFIAQSDGATKGINVKMTCYKANYRGTLNADNEIEEIRWLSSADFDKISEVDKKIFTYLKNQKIVR